jgi:membrane protein implicated in regulation of membrane protease activity
LRLLERTSPQTSLSGLLGWYIADLNKWVAQIATGYALAVAMLIAGAFAIAVAVGVGAAACFHWLETCYGPYVAYGTLGGVFLLAGLVSVVIALRLLKRPNPPVPRPRRQARALKRAIATPVVSRAPRCIPETAPDPTRSRKPWPAPPWRSSDGSRLHMLGDLAVIERETM